MLIPGEPLWDPRQPYRLPGSKRHDEVEVTTRRLLRLVAWFVVGWAIWLWVSQPIVDPCDEPSCVTTTT